MRSGRNSRRKNRCHRPANKGWWRRCLPSGPGAVLVGAGDGERGKLKQVVRVREFLRYHGRDNGVGDQREVFAVLLEAPHGEARSSPREGSRTSRPFFLIRCRRGGQERVHRLAARSGQNESASTFMLPRELATAGSCRHLPRLRCTRSIWPATRRDPSLWKSQP